MQSSTNISMPLPVYHLLSPVLKFIQNMVIAHTPTVSSIFRNKVMLASFLKDRGKKCLLICNAEAVKRKPPFTLVT